MNEKSNTDRKHIILSGFPGSGKSTVGGELSRLLNLPFIDTDSYIARKTGSTVSRIFEKYGEARFRELESETLEEIAKLPATVIATGGGMPCFNDNMEKMNRLGLTVYLKTTPETLCERLAVGSHRPLLAGKTAEELHIYVIETLRRREPYYEQAHIVLNTFREPAKLLAERIVESLRR